MRLSPRDSRVPAWADAEFKDWEAERMAVYAAQVDSLDQSVGRVMDALRRAGADRNTLVLFLSDNGASDQSVNRSLDKPGQTWRVDGTPTRSWQPTRHPARRRGQLRHRRPAVGERVEHALPPAQEHQLSKAASRRRSSRGGRALSARPAPLRSSCHTSPTSRPRVSTWPASRIPRQFQWPGRSAARGQEPLARPQRRPARRPPDVVLGDFGLPRHSRGPMETRRRPRASRGSFTTLPLTGPRCRIWPENLPAW